MKKILVTGATGNIGSKVVAELQKQNVLVRAFVRDAKKAEAMLGETVELSIGNFADVNSVRRALENVDSVFLACSNDPRQVEYETNLIDAAVASGVRRIVKLSALGAKIGSPVAFWDWHGKIEQHLRRVAPSAIILQPSFVMTNLFAAAEGVRSDAQTTNGAYTLVDATSPSGAVIPLHNHTREDEVIFIREGEVEVTINGVVRLLSPGEHAFMPHGNEHTFKITSPTPARVLVMFTPGGLEGAYKQIGRPAQRLELPPTPPAPTPEQRERVAQIFAEYGYYILPPTN